MRDSEGKAKLVAGSTSRCLGSIEASYKRVQPLVRAFVEVISFKVDNLPMRMGLTAALADLARTFMMEFVHKKIRGLDV